MAEFELRRAKESLRLRMRERRRAFPAEAAAAASASAQRLLLALPEFEAARIVCCYLAMPGEPDTALVLEACFRSGRILLAPAFRPDTRDYGLARLEAGRPLGAGPGGVPEPREPVWALDLEPGFWVVPGLAFDAAGGRLGHGRGHYDRLLAGRGRTGFRAGLAFSWQLADRVPMGPGDVRLEVVVTETRVYRRSLPPAAGTYDRAAGPPAGGAA
jgi:5-formyltetrahydrofolate cyclo-ligase